jgi:hypothetical protein
MTSYVLRYEPLDTSINRKMDIYKMCCKSKKLLQGKKKLICFYESNGKLHPQLIKLNYKQGIERKKNITWANLPNAKADISLSCTSGDESISIKGRTAPLCTM